MKRLGMLIGNFELNPINETNLDMVLTLFAHAPQRYHLKQNRLDYQPLFGKRDRASRLNLREQQKLRA